MLSVIIPSRNEIYLNKTIENILENAEGDIEIIVVLDGAWAEPVIPDNPKVTIIHHTVSIGQRQSINEAAKIAKGKYIMKLDAHSAVDKSFDVRLAADCEYDWTVIPRMYNLDTATWTPKLFDNTKEAIRCGKLNDYMYIGINDKGELRTLYYSGITRKHIHNNDKLIDDTMSCMGCGWFMHKDRFWELDGCDETHGGWGQQGIEVALKAWLSGGSLKVNKKTWFAHWFRGSDGGFPYEISGHDISKARKYSKDLWLNNKWDKATRKFEWVLDKFKPPTWENEVIKKRELPLSLDKKAYYEYTAQQDVFPKWFGTDIVKYPGDILIYEEIIFKNKPDFILETGTYRGGSSLFFAHMFDLIGKGHVITVDLHDHNPPKHPRITHLIGRATEPETLDKMKEIVGNGTCMVVLDSNHHRSHVKRELVRYHNFVTKGQYMVVEDTNWGEIGKPAGPDEAVAWFMNHNSKFVIDPLENKYIFSLNPGGWLRRRL